MNRLTLEEIELLNNWFDNRHKKFWLNAWKIKNWKESLFKELPPFSFMRYGE